MSAATSRCAGCGLALPERAGPAHPYIGASPACWARYGEALARAYGDPALRGGFRLGVDAYAVQHPGVEEPRAVRSVGMHLMRLCLLLEDGWPVARANEAMLRIAAARPAVRWLEPPVPNGRLTIEEVVGAEDFLGATERWARDVWGAWAAHHGTVRGWLPRALL